MKSFRLCGALCAALVFGLPLVASAQKAAFRVSDSGDESSAETATAYEALLDQPVADPSASDVPGIPMPPDPVPYTGPACAAPSCGAVVGSCGDGAYCDGGGCGHGLCWPCGCVLADMGEAWTLADHLCCCQCEGISTGGWVAQSFAWNPDSPADRFNGPVTWTDRSNDYQLNELYYYIGKAADTSECCGPAFGYRTDLIYGTNYRWNTSAGFESNFDFNEQFYGLAIPQAYIEAAYGDTSIKFGRFFSPVGYYVIGTANNFFPVLPYTFQYGEPFTHTGIFATHKCSDELSLGGGLTHGWDNTDNIGNPHAGGLATATYTIDDKNTFYYVGVFGPEPNFSGVNPSSLTGQGFTFRYLQTAVLTHKASDDITCVLQSDFGTQEDANAPGDLAQWYGVNSYIYWNQTCQTQWGMNFEWFRDQGGFRVGGVLPSLGSPNAAGLDIANRFGYDGSFYRFTFGVKHYFCPNLYGRCAFLADWYSGEANNPQGLRPFDDGNKDNQQLVVFDLIATF